MLYYKIAFRDRGGVALHTHYTLYIGIWRSVTYGMDGSVGVGVGSFFLRL